MIRLNEKITLEFLKREINSFSMSPMETNETLRNLRFTEETHFVKTAKALKYDLKELDSARYYSVVELEYIDNIDSICHVILMLPNNALTYVECIETEKDLEK